MRWHTPGGHTLLHQNARPPWSLASPAACLPASIVLWLHEQHRLRRQPQLLQALPQALCNAQQGGAPRNARGERPPGLVGSWTPPRYGTSAWAQPGSSPAAQGTSCAAWAAPSRHTLLTTAIHAAGEGAGQAVFQRGHGLQRIHKVVDGLQTKSKSKGTCILRLITVKPFSG